MTPTSKPLKPPAPHSQAASGDLLPPRAAERPSVPAPGPGLSNAAVAASARASPRISASQMQGRPPTPSPAPAGTSNAAVAANHAPGPARMEAAAASAPSGALDQMAALPASAMARGLAAARSAAKSGFSRMHARLANAPPSLEAPSGLPRKQVPDPPAIATPPQAKADALKPPTQRGETPELPETAMPPYPLPASDVDPGELDRVPEDQPQNFARYSVQMLEAMPTTDENVETSAGERPTVKLEAEADPAQMNKAEGSHRAAGEAAWIGARSGMHEPEGEDNIYPTTPKEKLKAHFRIAGTPAPKRARSAQALDDPEVATAVDAAAGGTWSDATARAQQDDAAAAKRKEDDEHEKRAETKAEIAAAEKEAVKEQTGQQTQAKETVAAARAGWKDELAAADETYTGKAKSLREDHDRQIREKRREGDEGASKTLEQAENDADAEKKKKVAEAEEKKREAKKESGGFLGWLKSKAKALINRIRRAINAIFDALRRAVKFIIDKAKKLAVWLIEKARRAIVGLIHAFGKLLELAADVFLAAFPEARKKAKAWIRRGVNAAERGVNAIADGLKKTVCKLLDALGAALDFILAAYQKIYNAILDAVEFIVVGLIELIEGIVRLAKSAAMVGDHFLGQIEEEGIGIDLTQPLPMEKPTGDAPDMKTATQSAMESGRLSPSEASLLNRPSLDNSDAAVEPVAELHLEPELLAEVVPRAAQRDYPFGENNDPANSREAILRGALESKTGALPMAGAAEPAQANTTAAAGADPASMTTDQQIEYLKAQELPHTCGAKAANEEPAKSDELPAYLRVYGAFTAGQRFSYMWSQIKKGLSQWWSCNWPKVIAAFAVGALIALLLGIITGGAIFAAIPPLLELLGAFFVGAAIVRAGSYIHDYLAMAWKSNLSGGAKALARAFAILAIELVFALLFNLGEVIKALKSGLKGTIKAAANAVKSGIKTTVKAAGEFAHAAVGIAKATVKNSKLIIKGFRQGFGEGIRSLGQLTREMLSKVHFRGFFFRLRGTVLELWGRFNPEALLAKYRLTQEKVEEYLGAIIKTGKKLSPEARAEGEALAKTVEKAFAADGGGMTEALRKQAHEFFEQFRLQRFDQNPLLGEVWERAITELHSSKQFGKFFRDGKLIEDVSAESMKEMYAAARGNMNDALKEVVDELEKELGTTLANRLAKLPENVQAHHLAYKAIAPELALAKENLTLALRKVGSGTPDELHDLIHLISAGGQGNRFRTMIRDFVDSLSLPKP